MLKNPKEILGALIDKQNVSFIGSVDADGFPNLKAMLPPRKRVGIKTFYFTTNTSSLRVAQYRANPKGCLYFCDRRSYQGIMLTGLFTVLEDARNKKMIWREGDTQYYRLGVTDPDYCVLKFTADSGRYYRDFASESFAVC